MITYKFVPVVSNCPETIRSKHLLNTTVSSSPNRHEAVLTIAPLDDSDGNLSLAVRWSSSWGMRDQSSLPPYWVLIKGSLPARPNITAVAGKNEIIPKAKVATEEAEVQNSEPHPPEETKEEPAKTDETLVSKTAKYIPPIEEAPLVRTIEISCVVNSNTHKTPWKSFPSFNQSLEHPPAGNH